MFEVNRTITRPIGINFAVLALLLVTSGFILCACQKPAVRTKSTETQKENQPAKVEEQKSDKQLKGNKSTKPDLKKDTGEDTQADDDPE